MYCRMIGLPNSNKMSSPEWHSRSSPLKAQNTEVAALTASVIINPDSVNKMFICSLSASCSGMQTYQTGQEMPRIDYSKGANYRIQV